MQTWLGRHTHTYTKTAAQELTYLFDALKRLERALTGPAITHVQQFSKLYQTTRVVDHQLAERTRQKLSGQRH